jgi:hypothetical protein
MSKFNKLNMKVLIIDTYNKIAPPLESSIVAIKGKYCVLSTGEEYNVETGLVRCKSNQILEAKQLFLPEEYATLLEVVRVKESLAMEINNCNDLAELKYLLNVVTKTHQPHSKKFNKYSIMVICQIDPNIVIKDLYLKELAVLSNEDDDIDLLTSKIYPLFSFRVGDTISSPAGCNVSFKLQCNDIHDVVDFVSWMDANDTHQKVLIFNEINIKIIAIKCTVDISNFRC